MLRPCNAAGLSKLDAIQSKALRIITGAMKSSPINALQVECADPPLSLRRQFLSDRFFFRCLQFSNHPLISKIEQLSTLIDTSSYWTHKMIPHLVISYRSYKQIAAPTHRSVRLPLYETSFEALVITPDVLLSTGIVKNDPNANTYFKVLVDGRWKGRHQLFTDASKHLPENCVGVGIYHSQYSIVQKVKLPPDTTVFTGEVFGIYKALEYILLMKLPKSIVFSDSMSTLQALTRFPFKTNACSAVVIMAREALLKCVGKGYYVSFAWIPSHSGIVGNEKADFLANEAITCGDIFYYKNYPQDLAALPKRTLKTSWAEAWSNSSRSKGKYYSSIQPQIPEKPWFFKSKLSKRATSVLIRMRLGHICSPAHLARFHILDDDICECGEDVGDANHIFFNCPLNSNSHLYSSLISLKVPLPTNISCLLHNYSIPIYNAIASFIELNNIKL